jgi:hypothetical protein
VLGATLELDGGAGAGEELAPEVFAVEPIDRVCADNDVRHASVLDDHQ